MKYLKYFENNSEILYKRIIGLNNIIDWENNHKNRPFENSFIDKLKKDGYKTNIQERNPNVISMVLNYYEIDIESFQDEWYIINAIEEDGDDSWSIYTYVCDSYEGIIQCLSFIKNSDSLE